MQREDLPQGFAIHETSTIATVWPALPCFNNLVFFDPPKPTESADTIVGELAEKWSWQDNYRNLVFFLRKDVKWHDGQPFTSKDVKFTFDMVREAPDAAGKLRLNPRKDWYANVEAHRGARPVHGRLPAQAAAALAADDARLRATRRSTPPTCRRAEHRTALRGHRARSSSRSGARASSSSYVKNPDYFVKGRPVPRRRSSYVVIIERGTRTAALQAGQLDVAVPGRDDQDRSPSSSRRRCRSMVITPVGDATSTTTSS